MMPAALLDRKRPPDLAVAQGDERQVDDENQDGQRYGCRPERMQRLGQEHRDPGHAAVDEPARLQETMQPHPRREDSEENEKSIAELTWKPFHGIENTRWHFVVATFRVGPSAVRYLCLGESGSLGSVAAGRCAIGAAWSREADGSTLPARRSSCVSASFTHVVDPGSRQSWICRDSRAQRHAAFEPQGRSSALSARWVGQDGHDYVGPNERLAPSDIQDIHIAIAGLDPRREVVFLEVESTNGNFWRFAEKPGGWRAEFKRAKGARTGDVFFEPAWVETGRPFHVLVRYDDGSTAETDLRGGKADRQAASDRPWRSPRAGSARIGRTAPARGRRWAPTDFRTCASISAGLRPS